jgi:hypothetical protein
MMRPHRAFPVLTVLIVASWACSLGGGGEVEQATTAVTPAANSAEVATAPSVTNVPPGEWLELEPPPPGGILDALQAKVEAGEWTHEEGLIQSLRIFTGDMQPEEAFAEAPSSLEGTGLVMEAMGYLASGADEGGRADIERLLTILAPDPERLLEYSVEAQAAHRRGVARQMDLALDCAALWYDGFPSGQNLKCFQYKSEQWMGSTIRVFIPQQSDLIWGFQSGYAEAAIAAVKNSLTVYSSFTINGKAAILDDVDVVFTLLETPKGDAMAIVPFELAGTQGCRTMIYPSAVLFNEDNKPSDGDFRIFEQTVAHEIFHCFTAWNFPDHWLAGMNGAYKTLDWWLEGGAEYFSNLVYPEVNIEWRWLDAWAFNSAKERIVHMDYDNFGFFQFLANRIGNNGLLGLFAGVKPTADTDGQASELAAYPNMPALFDDYARAFIDGTIADTDGSSLPTSPAFVLPEYRLVVDQATSFHLAGPPLVLMRYGFTFLNDRHYLLQSTPSGSAGSDEARPRDVTGAWVDLPPEVMATCAPTKYYYVMTSATPPAAPLFETELVIDKKAELGCDDCLIGTWDINIESFAAYAEAPFQETPGLYQFDSAGGLWRYHFRPNGTMTGEFDFLYAYGLNQENSPFGNDIKIDGTLTIEGTGDGTYASDGVSNLSFSLVEDSVAITQEIYMNGDKMVDGPLTPGSYGYSTGASAVYSCDAEAGELLLNFVPQTDLPPILFDRVSKTP